MLVKPPMPTAETALPGRSETIQIGDPHVVLGKPLHPPFSAQSESILLGMGCFWGAERRLWQQEGVYVTAAGYAGGYTQNPSYEEVCSGFTGHSEVVLVVYEGGSATLVNLLKVFWESHDPTQGMRQGNDQGTQYRSCIYPTSPHQLNGVQASRVGYQSRLSAKGYSEITTEIKTDQIFYYAEDYHQQYLAKNPNGYCGLIGTGVCL